MHRTFLEKLPKRIGLQLFVGLVAVVVALFTTGLASALPSSSGLVAHWSFDQSSGTTLTDNSGNSHHGTLSGGPAWASGQLNNALDYDGPDVVEVGDIPAIDNVGQVTLAGWIKRTASGATVLLGKQTTVQDLAIEAWYDGNIYFQLSNGSDTYGYLYLDDTNWHHVALVFDGSQTGNANRLKAYVDGTQETLTFNGTVGTTTTSDTTPFNIGQIGVDYTYGMIDDVWLYSRALSGSEIQELYNIDPGDDIAAPSNPTSLSATAASDSQVNLSWSASSDNVAVTGYRVYRNGVEQGTTASTSYQDTGLSATTEYTYTVRAYDAAGNQSGHSASDAATTLEAHKYVTGISSNGRYFVDQNDDPILIKGDSPWAMFADLSEQQVEEWADNRESYGYNAAIVSLIGNPANGATYDSGKTYDNVEPFVNGDVTDWNETYWERMEDYLTILKDRGISVLLYPIDGWNTLPNGAFDGVSNGDAYTYGQMVAERFENYPNIIWMVGGDYNGYDETINDLFTNVIDGIRSEDSERLLSAQFSSGTISTDVELYEPLAQWNFGYTYSPTYENMLRAYNRSPGARDPRPILFSEGNYEGEGDWDSISTTNETLRRQQLWALTSGSPGEISGSADWRFEEDWEERLDTDWVTQSQKIRDFFSGLANWHLLVPDDDDPMVTAGRGTKYDGVSYTDVLTNAYVTAAQTANESLSVIYVPTNVGNTNARTITIDLGRLPGSYTAIWVDPTDATSTQSASINGSTGEVTTPGTHSDGTRDWLLVIQED